MGRHWWEKFDQQVCHKVRSGTKQLMVTKDVSASMMEYDERGMQQECVWGRPGSMVRRRGVL